MTAEADFVDEALPGFAEPELVPPGTRVNDETAPYGFTGNGAPRGKPGRKPGQQTGTGKAATAKKAAPAKAAPEPPKKVPGRPSPPVQKTAVDYRPALMKLGGEAVTAASIIGLMKNRMDVLADAAAVANGLPAVAELANQAADQWPFVAAMLDKFLKVGPYATSGGGTLIMLAQLAVNHRIIPPGIVPGTQPPDNLVSSFIERQMQESEDFAAAMAMLHPHNANGSHPPADV